MQMLSPPYPQQRRLRGKMVKSWPLSTSTWPHLSVFCGNLYREEAVHAVHAVLRFTHGMPFRAHPPIFFLNTVQFRDGDPGCGGDNWEGEGGSGNPESFNPTALNVSQWVDSMVAIKATEAVLTAKHGCGYYLWNSSVQLPRGGGTYPYRVNLSRHGDVLQQFVDATSARGIGHGFYYSLTNNFFLNVFSHSARGNSSALPGQYPVTQAEFEQLAFDSVQELWTKYGNLTEIWMDGKSLPSLPSLPVRAPCGAMMMRLVALTSSPACLSSPPSHSLLTNRWLHEQHAE
jgi:hypothetical protein